jgi:hypothetical protein
MMMVAKRNQHEGHRMTLKHYHGSCHCGAVRYEADLDLARGTNRCNCSICAKARAWFAFAPAESFRLLQGAQALATYEWVPPGRPAAALSYRFCQHCGVRLYATGAGGQHGSFYALHVPTLDDVDVEELAAAPLHLVDGRHDRFKEPPLDTRLM